MHDAALNIAEKHYFGSWLTTLDTKVAVADFAEKIARLDEASWIAIKAATPPEWLLDDLDATFEKIADTMAKRVASAGSWLPEVKKWLKQ